MREIQSLQSPAMHLPRNAGLSMNQTFTGTVTNMLAGNKLLVSHGHQQFMAINASNIAVQTGNKVLFRVTGLSPHVSLKPLEVLKNKSINSRSYNSEVAAQVQQQQGVSRHSGFLQLLGLLRDPQLNFQPVFTKPILALLEQMKNRVLGRDDSRQSAQLKKAFLSSGLFLEHNYNNEAESKSEIYPDINKDLKFQLLRLLAILRGHQESPGRNPRHQAIQAYSLHDIQRLQGTGFRLCNGTVLTVEQLHALLDSFTEESLEHLLGNQQFSADNSHNGKSTWRFELPVQFISELIPVTITITEFREPEQEENKHETQTIDSEWTAEFNINLQHSGTINVMVRIKDDMVAVSLATTREEVSDFLNSDSEFLLTLLKEAGLTMTTFTCQTMAKGNCNE